MAVSVVQSAASTEFENAGTQWSWSSGLTSSNGNTLMVGMQIYGKGGSVVNNLLSVSDGSNNFQIISASQAETTSTSYGMTTVFAIAEKITGTAETITVTWDGNPYAMLSLWELTPCTLDQSTHNIGSGDSVDAGTLTPPEDGAMAMLLANMNGGNGAWTPDTGWTLLWNGSAGGGQTASASLPQAAVAPIDFHITAGAGGGTDYWAASGITLIPPPSPALISSGFFSAM